MCPASDLATQGTLKAYSDLMRPFRNIPIFDIQRKPLHGFRSGDVATDDGNIYYQLLRENGGQCVYVVKQA